MVENHVVGKPKDNDEIGLWGFDFFFMKARCGIKIWIDYVTLFINDNKAMDWELGESVVKDEHEGG